MTTARAIENLKEEYPQMFHPQYGAEKKVKKRTKQQEMRLLYEDSRFSSTVLGIHILRCAVKSLAAEARIIRKEERRAGLCYVEALREHRIRVLREESRYAGLALAFIRGKAKVVTENGFKPVDALKLAKKIRRFLPLVGDKEVLSWIQKDMQQ